MRVLLVDDELVALQGLKRSVDWVKYGFDEVETALNAREARGILATRPVDLVLCDIEMPGEDGMSLMTYIRGNMPQTDVIMETCHTDFAFLRTSIQNGVRDYLQKPIDYDELDRILMEYAAEKGRKLTMERVDRAVEKAEQQRGGDEPDSKEWLYMIFDYIDGHLQDKIYVEELATLVHVNERHLMRIFKKETGKTINEYITEQRIHLASDLLKNTDQSINFISDCIGCENDSYFTKLFKKYTGLTPREYRKQYRMQ